MSDLKKYDLQSYIENDKEIPFTIEAPHVSLQKMLSKDSKEKLIKEANFLFKSKYLKKNGEFNSLIDLSEGHLATKSWVEGFIPGKIYTYFYSPKWKAELDYYDHQPLMLSLGQIQMGNSIIEAGINLHFLPPKAIAKIMELTWIMYENKIENNFNFLMKENFSNQIPLPIRKHGKKLYDSIGKTNYRFAIRHYLRNRMKQVKIVEYTDWKYIPLLESKWVVGASKAEIYQKWKENQNKRNK